MEKMKKLTKLFKSSKFKKLMIVLGIIFYFSTFIIAFNPKPFLKFSYVGVFIFSLFGPGMILVPVLVGKLNIYILAFVVALGMAFNDSVTWLVGKSGDVVLPRSKKIERLEKTINRFGSWALFFWSLIPFPYDLVGLIAGYLQLSYKRFIIPTFFGKFIRFILLGLGIMKFLI